MVILSIIVLVLVMLFLFYLQKTYVSFNKRVFAGLILGLVFGAITQVITTQDIITKIINIYNIVGVGYIRFLQMLVYPIIVIATIRAMTKIGENTKIFKSLSVIIALLIGTAVISAGVGILVNYIFNINFDSLAHIVVNDSVLESLGKRENILDKPIYVFITDFITVNPFLDLTGARGNSIASLVIFSIILGIAYLGVRKKEEAIAEKFASGVEVLYKIIMRLVVLILRLTPYGIFALIYKVAATSSIYDISTLFSFLGASYIAIIIMFVVHAIILKAFGFNVTTFYKKIFSLLTFAFVSRSSVASIPLNIRTQTKQMGISESVATSGASFGAIMGQNGCAGIYPAMLAVAMAPTVGIDPFSISFIFPLLGIIAVSSFGVAGVGGGATFAAIAVLSSFGMPLTIVALLISIEPLVDMARTALNINGAVVASAVSAKLTHEIDIETYNDLSTIDGKNPPID